MAVQDEIKYQQILVKPKGVMRSLKVTFDDTRGEVHYWGYHQGSNLPHISGLILTVVLHRIITSILLGLSSRQQLAAHFRFDTHSSTT